MDPESMASREHRLNAVIAAYLEGERTGAGTVAEELVRQHPDLADELRSFFANRAHFQKVAAADNTATIPPAPARQEAATRTVAPNGTVAPAVGTSIRYFGDYELLEEIARGGMGVVFRARQVSLNRVVALKMILAGQLAGPEDVQRFLTEAQAAAALQHPNIVAIHEVGQHDGQHYFSMDFVEGQSLAALIRERPLLPPEAARHVETVARAIHYAHQKGTLHRDLKPANVLLDHLGQPRVTDFGLAKNLANVGGQSPVRLTQTGAVLGTPSYMPPEQAGGQHEAVGPASDVYSLGAVLYDLVTGRPPFQAATTLDTLLQVIHQDPAAPRTLNPTIPRDLETIILKCLAKQPARRYASAQDLADDLRAFLDGKPIKARRPTLGERAARWLDTHRPVIARAALVAAAALLIVGGVVAGWLAWREASLVQLRFVSDGPPLNAQVSAAATPNKPLARSTIPAPEALSLASGDYELHLSARFRLSETFHFFAAGGKKDPLRIELKDRLLWEELKVPKVFDVVDFSVPVPGKPHSPRNDFVLVTQRGLQRVDGRTSEVLWATDLTVGDQPALAQWDHLQLSQLLTDRQTGVHFENNLPALGTEPPRIVQPAPDIDGDGVRDIVWASRANASLLAVSGKNGQVLWWRPLLSFKKHPDIPNAAHPEPDDPVAFTSGMPDGLVVGQPLVVADDRHGPVLIATFFTVGGAVTVRSKAGVAVCHLEHGQWVAAVAAQTGKELWRYRLPAGKADAFGPMLHSVNATPTVLVQTGAALTGLDPRTGKQLWSTPVLGDWIVARPQIVDLDGDGQLDLLALMGCDPRKVSGQQGMHVATEGIVLAAFTLPAGKEKWRRSVQSFWTHDETIDFSSRGHYSLDWPVLVSVSKNGKGASVAIPDDEADRGGVLVLDGATGNERWRSALPDTGLRTDGYRRFTAGPDLDGDGHADVFRMLLIQAGNPGPKWKVSAYLLAEAFSGVDGRILWQRCHDLHTGDHLHLSVSRDTHLQPLSWLPAGPEGWPLLVVPLKPRDFGAELAPRTLVLSAGSGKRVHDIIDLADWQPPVDLDGDGLPDLIGMRPSEIAKAHDWSRLHAIRMYAPDAWRRLQNLDPVEDLNGDGFADLVDFMQPRVTAISGKNGALLWQSNQHAYGLTGARPGDLDGDGAADVLGTHPDVPGLLHAFSGKTGGKIWQVELLPQGTEEKLSQYSWGKCADLDGDGQTEITVFYQTRKEQSGDNVDYVGVVAGRTGQFLWRQELGKVWPGEMPSRLAFADLNGDEVLDVIVALAPYQGGHTNILAFDGRAGAPLWQRKFHGGKVPFAAGDLDGDGKAEVVVSGRHKLLPGYDDTLFVLDGRDGKMRAEWYVGDVAGEVKGLSAPTLVRHKKGASIAVLYYTINSHSFKLTYLLRVFGMNGNIMAEHVLAHNHAAAPSWMEKPPFHALDSDGDGQDELLYVKEDRLVAVTIGSAQPLWQSVQFGKSLSILDVLPATDRLPVTVTVRSGETVWGLEAATGKPRWRCDGPGEFAGLLPCGDALPRIAFLVNGQFTACRLCLPTDDDGNYVLGLASHGGVFAPVTNIELQPLPWVAFYRHDGASWFPLLWFTMFAGFLLCLALLRFRGLLNSLLAAYLLAGVGLCGLTFWLDQLWPWEQYHADGWYLAFLLPFMSGLAALYILAFIVILWLMLRSWLRWWPSIAGTLSVTLAPVGPLVVVLVLLGQGVRFGWRGLRRLAKSPTRSAA